ncbi:amino acid/polyamine/organocation transporter, APC superfamily [Frankineae bacterium MT45]|nr:amino acid/polyamine/organocation transporter, APC superfamily [Frankineae bacterium MT45]
MTAVTTDAKTELGYEQELHRGVGVFASFAAGFSFVSILTTVFQLFGLGFFLGGASFFWTWPVVFAGQLCVALLFSELAGRWPVSGAIFQWSSRLAGTIWGWFTGWIMIIGQILTTAVAAIAIQAVLPSIWSGFQIVGGHDADPSILSRTGAQNAVVLGVALLVITTIVNVLGIRQMAAATSVGVAVEIVAVITLIVLLFCLSKRGPSVVMHNTGWDPKATGISNYFFAWLASSLMAAYVMVGFDSAGELSEETYTPRKTTPKTIIRALTTSGAGGLLLILGGLMAASSLTDGNLASGGLAWVVSDRLGNVVGRLLLCCVAVAVFACTLACQTSGARMMYSMSREKAFPGHRALAKVSPRTGTPIITSIVVGLGAAIALLVNIDSTTIFTALASLCIGMLYVAYFGVTIPLLIVRIRRANTDRFPAGVDEDGKPLFSLGKWGIPVNVAAVIFQAIMIVNLLWPRAVIYDLSGDTWWLKWSGLLFVGITLAVGGIYFAVRQLHNKIVLVHVPHSAALLPVRDADVAAGQAAM